MERLGGWQKGFEFCKETSLGKDLSAINMTLLDKS
jgi:hypothetical protein